SVDNVSFSHPIRLGHVVTLKAQVTRAFNTSMEVHIEVQATDVPNNKIVESHEAFFTMVAMDLSEKKSGGTRTHSRNRKGKSIVRRRPASKTTQADSGRKDETRRC